MDLDELEGIKQKLNLSTMSKPALIGLAAVLVVVAVMLAARLMGAATTPEFQVVKASEQSSQAEAASSVRSEAAEKTIFVHVAGAVVNSGLYEIDSDARVGDAIEAAGGFAENALPDSVNLARQLNDGEQIVVKARKADGQNDDAGIGGSGLSGEGGVSASDAPSSALVNINTADVAELTTLPGIGEATANKIVSDRKANGPFATIDDLTRVAGIGEKKLESLRDLVCL